jgi:hypothetical protein
MGMQRGTRIRHTTIRRGDTRAVGSYEQTADWPSTLTAYAGVADRLDGWFAVRCSGHLDAPQSLRYSDLFDLAVTHRDGDVAVRLLDLLAVLQLRSTADVLMVTDAAGVTMGLPLSEVLQRDDARLTLGTGLSPLEMRDGFPIRLDMPGWTTPGDRTGSHRMSVMSIRAVTFNEFIGCP